MKSYIFLDRICFFAHHGVGEQETLAGNEFTVSLRLQVNIAPAMQTDDVADTVSYADVYEAVKAEMKVPSKLLEHVGGRIVKRLFGDFPQIENIELKLSKRNPPMGADIEAADEVNFAKFGRRAILNLRQTLASKILELEKDSIYNKYIDKVGTIINAEVYQIWKKEMLLLDDEGNELLLPKTEQIPSDFYRKGETARAVVARVDNKNNNPKIILSRTSPVFLQRLFEMEVPEINDGLITIKKIARIPGERAKIAVESYDDRIDPVGACVGVKGSRIHGIVRELRNENIDVINYTSNIQLFIQRALSPAKISSIRLNEEEHKAEVFLKPEEVSLAIGKGGLNIKLASMLTEYTIDVFRELDEAVEDEDIYLDEFRDEIDGWVIDAIKAIGIDTAKAVLNAPREMLIEKTDLEEETVDEVLRILKSEFEEGEN